MTHEQNQSSAVNGIDYEKLVSDAWLLHKYRCGTPTCVAFKRGAEWQSRRATQPAQADQSPAEGDALAKALERMDRARAILTDGNPRPVCNWGMLDTADLRATSDVRPKGADLNLSDPAVQKRLAAQWGYVQAPAPGAEPHVWLYDFIDGETTVRNWSTTNKAEAFAPGNFNQRGYVPAEN